MSEVDKSVNFDVTGLQFRVTDPSALKLSEWEQVQEMAFDAFRYDLTDRPRADVEYFLGINWDDPSHFANIRINPELAIERGRLRGGQLFANPSLVLAYEKNRPVGYMHIADNTSGTTSNQR